MIDIDKRIAVISDIHIGEFARARDLCPPLADSARREDHFLDEFRHFVRRRDLAADILIVPGDMTSRARHSEFLHAAAVVNDVAETLGVHRDHIYFVPGNHDVNWDSLNLPGNEQDKQFHWTQRYTHITSSNTLFMERQRTARASMFEEPYASIWEDDIGLVASLNSAWHDSPDAEMHHGRARDATLAWLDENLTGRTTTPHQLRIFVVHHHPFQYSDPFPDIPEYSDFSIIQNAERLLSLLRRHRFDLLIHGHKHIPRFQTHLVESDYPMPFLGAGSFCVELPSSYAGQVLNQFHLLKVKGRLNVGSRIVGRLENWAFAGSSGWTESNKRFCGIDHVCGFGYFATGEEFKQRLFEELDDRFTKATIVRYADLLADDVAYEYVPGHTIAEALAEYGARKCLTFLGSDYREFILVGTLNEKA